MTLAAILGLYMSLGMGITSSAPVIGPEQSAEQPAPPPQPQQSSQSPQTEPSGQSSDSQKPKPASPGPPRPTKKPTAKTHRPQHKKTAARTDCKGSSPTTSAANSGGNKPADPAPSSANAPGNCPPAKVVVQQGGASEPSVELAGGAGGDRATRDLTNQLLDSTEQNLKTIAGRTLTANQQDIANQIHQYMRQSKAAVASGDLERGRNLAQKAHLLSDELVKQ